MMPNGMSSQSQGMQRNQPNSNMQSLHNQILKTMSDQMPQFVNSWQATYDIRERANKTVQL